MSSFQELNLPQELMRSLEQLKFITPTEIQQAVIPLAMSGRDVIACAQTGSGKTAAYAIPMITRLIANPDKNAIVLVPTRELANQITKVIEDLTFFSKRISVASLIGGASMDRQLMALKRNPRIIVATPGRMIDHLQRNSQLLKKADVLVLDEGDRMLDMGFQPQLDRILPFLPRERQTSLFTATLPPKVRKLAERYLQNPESINIGPVSQPVTAITQSLIQLSGGQKNDRIIDELNKRKGSVIVFLRTKRRTDQLTRHLVDYGFSVTLIHGDRTQGQRNKAIQNFRDGSARILCATDIAARGIDIPEVELVINYDLPMMNEDYVHRIGRTARNGATGEAVSFVTPEDITTWRSLVREFNIPNADIAMPERKHKPAGPGGNGNRNNNNNRRPSFKSQPNRQGFKKTTADGQRNDTRRNDGRSENRRNDSRDESRNDVPRGQRFAQKNNGRPANELQKSNSRV
jgi:ATP-dependent RNA helicase DeaD